MSTKIKFNIFNTLFHLFSSLADRTNGWKLFVKPKLLFGSLIMGLGISACSLREKPSTPTSNDILCYEPAEQYDTIANDNSVTKSSDSIISTTSYTIEGISANCYDGFDIIVEVLADSTEKALLPIEDDSMEVHTYVEEMPEFPEGEKALRDFIQKELRYPAVSCYEGGIEGKVYCRFIVEKDGTISNIEVTRSVHSIVDQEAVRVIKSMPPWIPGKQNGKPVRVYYSVPVIFKLQ